MLDGMNLGIAFSQCGRAVGFSDVFNARFDLGFAFEVYPAKKDAGIGRRREKRHVHPVAAMEADAGITDGTSQSLLLQHRRSKTNQPANWKQGFRRRESREMCVFGGAIFLWCENLERFCRDGSVGSPRFAFFYFGVRGIAGACKNFSTFDPLLVRF